jgi:phage N-6-adenine-methyltransferase
MQERLFTTRQEGRTSDDYDTPKWIFDALSIEFDLDVACAPDGPLHTPCKAYFTQEDDGLALDWHGTVWVNPPFSHTNDWAYRFMQHANGIGLFPMSQSKWFDELWQTSEAVMALPPNLKFVQGKIFMPAVLCAYGHDNVAALKQSGIGRVR